MRHVGHRTVVMMCVNVLRDDMVRRLERRNARRMTTLAALWKEVK